MRRVKDRWTDSEEEGPGVCREADNEGAFVTGRRRAQVELTHKDEG